MKLDLKKLKLRKVNEQLQSLDRKVNDRDFTIINPEGNHAVCAEHGIGRSKVKDLIKYSSPVKLDLMRKLKDVFDPNGIMNPGVIIK